MTYCRHNVTEGYCLDCLRAERLAALARVGVLERVLRSVEWAGYGDVNCPVCDFSRGCGEHAPGCVLAAALSSPPPHDWEGAGCACPVCRGEEVPSPAAPRCAWCSGTGRQFTGTAAERPCPACAAKEGK